MDSLLAGHEPVIFSLGEPIIDWIYYVDDSFLEEQKLAKGGCIKMDREPFLKLQSRLDKNTPHMVPGGSAANTLKGLAKLGHLCRYVGKIGQDDLGKQFQESLQSHHIASRLLLSPRHTTQVLSLVTPDGERTMRSSIGASDDLNEKDLSSEDLANVAHVHIEGYTLLREKVLSKLLRLAKKAGATVSIDLASRDLVELFQEKLKRILKNRMDIVIANEDESKALTGLKPREACFEMQKLCPIAVVLLGENGCIVGSKGSIFDSYGLPVPVVDTTGAGDLFASGFLHGFLTHQSLEQCAYLGNLLGSTSVTEIGSQISDTNWEKLKELI
jgi:sugar/nucleoside kinase (ribokinase family)